MRRLLAIIEANGGLGNAPQPAGRQVADWYREANPSPDDMLHVIAHALDALTKQGKG